MMKLTLGCTTRPFGKSHYTGTFMRIAGAGFTDVAIFFDVGIDTSSDPKHTNEVRAAAEAAGLVPSMLIAHAQFDEDDAEDRYLGMVDQAALLGASWLLDLGTGNVEHLDRYVALMKVASERAQDAGVRITAKPHGGITTSSGDLAELHKKVDHPAYGICYDPGNIIYYSKGSELPEMNIDAVAPIVTTAIIKDCVIKNGIPDVMITPGEGLVNFDIVIKRLVDAGFDGPLYLECVGGTETAEIDGNIRRTREYIEAILARID